MNAFCNEVCPLLFCDSLNQMCIASPEVRMLVHKDNLEKRRENLRQMGDQGRLTRSIARLGFKRYDRRRKPDTPKRAKWRQYKASARELRERTGIGI